MPKYVLLEFGEDELADELIHASDYSDRVVGVWKKGSDGEEVTDE